MRATLCFVLISAVYIGVVGPAVNLGQDTPQRVEGAVTKSPASLIALDSDEGQRLLWESTAKEGYVPLSIYFTTQQNLAYCSVATGTMLLNGLGIPRPASDAHRPYRLFTQENFFTPEVSKV